MRHGLTMYYDENGVKFAEEMWTADARHGRYKQWSLDGELECEGQFSEGDRHGTWKVYKVGRSSIPLGCPPVQDLKSFIAHDAFSNRHPPWSAALGSEEHEYDQGRRIRSTEPCRGPWGTTEIEVTEWGDEGYPKHRVRWTSDRSVKLEEELYKEHYESKSFKGWYASGDQYFEQERVDGPGRLGGDYRMRYWKERTGELLHDFKISEQRICADRERIIDEVFAVRFVFCGTGGIPPMPIQDQLYERVRVLADKQPLDAVLGRLSASHDIPILLDRESFELAGLGASVPITIETRGLPLHSALHLALEPHALTYVRLFDQLVITTWDRIPKGAARSAYDPCGPPEGWINPTGLDRYDDGERVERFKQLQVHRQLKLENASLETVAKAFSDACEVAITVDRDKFSASDLNRRTVSLHARHEDAFDLFGSALFQLGAKAVERNGAIVILPAEPLKRRPRPPEPAP
jgi:antitoxin component YwqK of YwqJK toxin-antitoxin module